MIIPDTSVWIAFLKSSEEVKYMFTPYLRKGHIYTNSAIFGELYQGARNKRERYVLESFWEFTPKVDETECFLMAGQLSNQYKLYAKGVGLIDSYILASAKKSNMAIWTLDKNFLAAIDMIEGGNIK